MVIVNNNPLVGKILTSLNSKRLNLIILPTEQCNFRCTYCYEDFKIGRMKESVKTGIKNFLANRFNDLEELEFSFFGGEPLIAKDIIFEILGFTRDIAPQHLNYYGNITTNGFNLDTATFLRLIDNNINTFQVSLDGDEQHHNTSRVLAGGKPTFETIWRNLVNTKNVEKDFTIIIRVHFTGENFESLTGLIEKLNLEFAFDKRYRVYFKSIERLGGKNDQDIPKADYKRKAEIKKWLESKLLDPAQSMSLHTKTDPYMCYASMPNSLVIRADGKIGKCTVALSNEKNNIGIITPQGDLEINSNYNLWLEGIETGDMQMLACPLSKIDPFIKGNEK